MLTDMALLIANGDVVTVAGRRHEDICIQGERIVAMGQGLARDGCRVIDARGCLVLPGGIDAHTHLNLTVGQRRVSDGFYHGSLAAAYGGTTCCIEHPGFGPPGCDLDHQVRLYRRQADPEVVIDYGLHGVIQHVDEQVLHAIAGLRDQGITSIKVYLTYACRIDDEGIIAVLEAARRAGVLVAFHAENHAIVTAMTRKLRRRGASDPLLHARARPGYAEAEAICRLIRLARAAGEAPIYIVHLSTAEGLEIVRRARCQGSEVYVETCPQYLCLNEAAYQEADGIGCLMAPPLRRQEDCQALWQGLADGDIDVVATDHCSFSLACKRELGSADIFQAPGGIPGVETRLALLFSHGVNQGRISLTRFVELTATNPARIMGLAPDKGDLARGGHADLVIFDPNQEMTLSGDTLHQRVDYTPFAGQRVRGMPRTVLARGRVVIEEGRLLAAPGSGRFCRRRPFRCRQAGQKTTPGDTL